MREKVYFGMGRHGDLGLGKFFEIGLWGRWKEETVREGGMVLFFTYE